MLWVYDSSSYYYLQPGFGVTRDDSPILVCHWHCTCNRFLAVLMFSMLTNAAGQSSMWGTRGYCTCINMMCVGAVLYKMLMYNYNVLSGTPDYMTRKISLTTHVMTRLFSTDTRTYTMVVDARPGDVMRHLLAAYVTNVSVVPSLCDLLGSRCARV